MTTNQRRYVWAVGATVILLAVGAFEAAYARSTTWQIAWPLIAVGACTGWWWRAIHHGGQG